MPTQTLVGKDNEILDWTSVFSSQERLLVPSVIEKNVSLPENSFVISKEELKTISKKSLHDKLKKALPKIRKVHYVVTLTSLALVIIPAFAPAILPASFVGGGMAYASTDLALQAVASPEAIEVVAQTSGGGWVALISKIIWISDFLMDALIIFTGILWMFGHRTKAIEMLFSSGIGYTIIRHHQDIKDFFGLL